jgi:hypothetical protein
MNPAQKALWFIESHLARELTLEVAARKGLGQRLQPVGCNDIFGADLSRTGPGVP